MQKKLTKMVFAFMTTLPLVFSVVFFGYFPLRYDIVLKTDNIVGEGICSSYGSRVDGHTTVNMVTFYFGSELKTATIKGSNYDAGGLNLIISDVSAFDILEIDSYIKGIHLCHFSMSDIFEDGTVIETSNYTLTARDGILHTDIIDPDQGATITFDLGFIPTWFLILYFAAMLAIAALMAVFLIQLTDRFPTLRFALMNVVCIVVVLLAGCFFCDSLPYVQYVPFLLNWLLLFAVATALNALTLPFLGTVLVTGFTLLWYIANYFVIPLRGKPIMPADLKALGTAKEVMGGYTFIPDWKVLFGSAVVILYVVILVLVWKHNKSDTKQSMTAQTMRRGLSLVAAVLMLIIGINTKTFQSLSTFTWDATLMANFHKNGMVLTYLKCVSSSQIKKPEGYSQDLVNNYLTEYQVQPDEEKTVIHPTRIIMVMNEAFSDLRSAGLNPAINVMPFIDSLDENTVEGSLFVSVFGGGTCNTEFEALTGNTLAFLGAGAYPYTENVTHPLFSLASYFHELGYLTEAFHPNAADNWNRDMVYPNLGFESFHSIDDFGAFKEVVYLHDLPADINDYLYIEAVDKENSGRPRFLFDVTMQNHAPYDRWLDVEKVESVVENGSNYYLDTQIYLSLVKASDDEVRQLVETYQDIDEPTMIIFFGDHQPGLPNTAINEIYQSYSLDMFKSKFFIWTNYETKAWHNAGISANYLPWLILDRGNFPLPPYVQMLKELYEHYPIISSQGVMDIEGNIYDSVADVMDDPLIQKYQYIQYANLFDEIDSAWFEVP